MKRSIAAMLGTVALAAALLVPSMGSAKGDPVEASWAGFESSTNQWPTVKVSPVAGGWVGKVATVGEIKCVGFSKADTVGREIWRITAKNGSEYTGTSVVDPGCEKGGMSGNTGPDEDVPQNFGLTEVQAKIKVLSDGQALTLENSWIYPDPEDAGSQVEGLEHWMFTRIAEQAAGEKVRLDRPGSAKVKPRRGGPKQTFTVRVPTKRDDALNDYSYALSAVIQTRRRNCSSRVRLGSVDGGGLRLTFKLRPKRAHRLAKNVSKAELKRRFPGHGVPPETMGGRAKKWCPGIMNGVIVETRLPPGSVTGGSFVAVDSFRVAIKAGGKKKAKGRKGRAKKRRR